jgi:hypothetical protein
MRAEDAAAAQLVIDQVTILHYTITEMLYSCMVYMCVYCATCKADRLFAQRLDVRDAQLSCSECIRSTIFY